MQLSLFDTSGHIATVFHAGVSRLAYLAFLRNGCMHIMPNFIDN